MILPGKLKSFGALLAGFSVVVILSIGSDLVMQAAGILPAKGQPVDGPPLVIAAIYRTLYSTLGAYVTARLAPHHPMQHALISGAVGFVLCAIGAMVTWNAGPEYQAHWYPLTLVATALPSAWIGGKLQEGEGS